MKSIVMIAIVGLSLVVNTATAGSALAGIGTSPGKPAAGSGGR